MRHLFFFFIIFCSLWTYGQNPKTLVFKKDSLLVIPKNPAKGFHHDYLLFIPKGTPIHKRTVTACRT